MKRAGPCATEGHAVGNSNWERWFDNISQKAFQSHWKIYDSIQKLQLDIFNLKMR